MLFYNTKNINRAYLAIFASLTLFFSCATTVSFGVERPAKLDLNGAKSISVLPFQNDRYYNQHSPEIGTLISILDFFSTTQSVSSEEQRCLNYLKNEIESRLINSPHITVINSTAVQQALRTNSTIPCDVYLTGSVSYFDINDTRTFVRIPFEHTKIIITDEGKKIEKRVTSYRTEIRFIRNVEISIFYNIVDSKTNRILAFDSFRISRSSGQERRLRDLPSAFSLLDNELTYQSRKIFKDLQPYYETKSIALLKDRSKNPLMKEADQLVKSNSIKESISLFEEIFKTTNLFEAGYNAAILKMSLGKLSDAEREMENLYNDFRDSRATAALSDIRYEISQAKRLQKQLRN